MERHAGKTLIVIVGPTGVGKTDLGVAVAEHFGAPVVSADSRQIYRDLPIGTAHPDADQLRRVRHYFIATHALTDDFNCGAYEAAALRLLDDLFAEHDTVVAVGGSGLYVKALCEGMDDLPQCDPSLRGQLAARLRDEGLEALADELRQRDPDICRTLDLRNPARVMRALEVCISTGVPCSSLRTGRRRERPFRIVKVGLDMDRAELYARIDRRVDVMMERGLEAEARAVYHLRGLNSLQTVGYREMFEWFDGRITRDEAVELIKRNSRRYAKRQLTWFRRDDGIAWFRPSHAVEIIDYIESKVCSMK